MFKEIKVQEKELMENDKNGLILNQSITKVIMKDVSETITLKIKLNTGGRQANKKQYLESLGTKKNVIEQSVGKVKYMTSLN